MRQVFKRPVPPAALASKGYRDDAVARSLSADQHGVCYLCERQPGTAFSVDHLKSQNHFPGLVNTWSNLFLACSYCNGKKQDDYDDILDPVANRVEDIIAQRYDAATTRFSFASKSNLPGVAKTIQLLELIFNGRGKMRTLREEEFLREFQDEFGAFVDNIIDYQCSQTPEMRQRIVSLLRAGQEYLGFKHWYLMDYPQLWKEFGDCIGAKASSDKRDISERDLP